ncbi:hypothetical protein [Oceaniglobus indicus]|nr:hypothetical protein [Oceaniglobus indicus]
MKAFLLSLVALIVIAFGMNYGLNTYAGFSAAERTTVGHSVRLD